MADHDNPERSAYNEGYDEGPVDGEERGVQLEERAVEQGRAEERAATQARIERLMNVHRDEKSQDYDDGRYDGLFDLRAELEGSEPAPQSDHGLTVSDIAAHLRAEIASITNLDSAPDWERRAALVDTLTWLERENPTG